MKKKIFLSLLVVLSLFLITGCTKEEQDELNKQLEGVDNFYLNGGGSNKQNNDEPNSQSEPPDNKISNKNELLVGTWQSDIQDYYETHGLGCDFYIFSSDGTWEYIQVRTNSYDKSDIYSQLKSKSGKVSGKYSYDGQKIQFDVDGKYDDYMSETDLTVNGNKIEMHLDYGRYLKEDRNMQIGKFEKYR